MNPPVAVVCLIVCRRCPMRRLRPFGVGYLAERSFPPILSAMMMTTIMTMTMTMMMTTIMAMDRKRTQGSCANLSRVVLVSGICPNFRVGLS